MGKEGGVGCTRKKRPRFFKVFFPGRSSKQLEISPAFGRHIQRVRHASTCLLRGPSRKVWRVDMIRNRNGVFFRNGWEEFVRDHSLEAGEFLVFQYEGRLRFSVLVFDASMCEKESVFGASSSSQGLVGSVEGDFTAIPKRKRGAGASLAGRPPPRKGDALPKAAWKPHTRKRHVGVWMSQRRPVTEVEIKKAHQAASSFKSTNPFQMLVMRKYGVYSGHILRVPLSFSRQYLPLNTKMTLWDPTGKPWAVNYISCSGSYFFSGGWRKFALANFLEQDDACIFELIGANEIRVHIFRVVEEIKPLIRKVGF